MKIGNFRRLSRADFPDAPDILWRMLESFQDQIELLTSALQGHLTFEDNFNVEIKDLDLEDNTTVTFKLNHLKGKPIGVILLDRGIYDYSVVALEILDEKTARAKIAFTDEAPTDTTTIRVAFLGG